MVHTITSTNIPAGAASFDQIWQAPADTFFQYVPQVVGLHEYVCTPHIQFGMVGSIDVIAVPLNLEEDDLIEKEVVIFPNPATDFIGVLGANTNAQFKIYGLKGEHWRSGTLSESIEISTLAKGIYILEIIGDKPRKLLFIKN